MIVDIIFLCLMVIAVFKGFTKGLIVAVFSLISLLIGLAAALRLSAIFAAYLQEHTSLTGKWLPFLAFIIIFIAVALVVRMLAKMLKGAVSLAMLGWVDTIGGILLYALLYTFIYSVVLFFGTQLNVIGPKMQSESTTYSYIVPWGPRVISTMGVIMPWFKNVFEDLQLFFGNATRETV
ncbi:CvpA family protein [Segetibacter sp. 3557_3]|uniref:CvpA family protein n=1 Tax=Segetibacter sp. 3557_3 TaxID=2547429 RepID=UPI001058E3B8|nr:CvpA family protein [Segetibacter sp. 3557_3]TDH23248.1 CvpA family protein [Segetibacter sp. 3557_3]